MFPSCWHRALYAFTLAAATFFAQSVNAQASPQCALSANPAIISAGASSTLTASCSPAATSFEWTGGTCDGTTSSNCTVTPSVTAPYSVIGIVAGATSNAASTAVFTVWPYDGIYQWDSGYYLSLHRIGGDTVIGTIYWVYTVNTGTDTFQVGTLANPTAPKADTFDLFHGQTTGSSSATISGTRFFRACTLSYDLIFNNDSSLTVHQKDVSNSPGVSVADVDCAAQYNTTTVAWTIPRVF